MNEIFDIKRFGVLLQEDARSYFLKFREAVLVSTVSYLGVCLLYWMFSLLGEGASMSRSASFGFMTVFFVVGILRAPYTLYGYTNHKKKGISYAMLPVSSLEKFASMFLMVAIVTPIILWISLILVDSILAVLTVKTYLFSYVLEQTFSLETLYGIALLSSTFLLGNLVFYKSKISKTILAIILFWIVLVTIVALVIVGVRGTDMSINISWEDIENLVPFLRVLVKTIMYSIPAVLFFFTYRKIKAQQY